MMNVKIFEALRSKVQSSHKAHGAVHVTHNAFHLTYLGAAFAEGHGIYSLAAGGLFIVVLAAIFFKIAIAE